MADLAHRLEALERAVSIAEPRFGAGPTARGRALVDRARKRMALSLEHTVVALAGGTGSGKSSLFNAIAGDHLAQTGVRRPTTNTAQAAVWGPDDASGLLDWLDVPRRHHLDTDPSRADLSGLVLLDLPDFDSTADAHRLEVDRLVEVVDLFVWVVDPQKYADAALHERYLRPLAAHREVMVVALNQADRLDPTALDACVRDLRGLLAADGLRDVDVITTSATGPDGAAPLRDALAAAASSRRAALARLAADVDVAVADLEPLCASGPVRSASRKQESAVVEALAAAAGVPAIADAAATSYRMQASGSVGWPLTRWVRRLRPDPLRRLHLDRGPSSGRTSVPAPAAATRAHVSSALRGFAQARSAGLPSPWRAALERATDDHEIALDDDLDAAVGGADLRLPRRPRWWALWRVLHWALVGAAVVGAVWLLALIGIDYLRLPQPSLPEVANAPLPTVLLVGGLTVGFLLAVAGRPFVAVGASRRRRVTAADLHERVRAVAARRVLEPIDEELAAHDHLCRALAEAQGSPSTRSR